MPLKTLEQAMSMRKNPTQSLGQDILMRSIKMLDIGYLTIIYVFIAIICAKITDMLYGEFDEKKEEQKSLVVLFIELIVSLWFYGVLIYVIRNIVPLIPFPLNGFQGFDHFKVKEVYNPTIFTFVFLLYCNILMHKIKYFYERLPGREKKEHSQDETGYAAVAGAAGH